MESYETVDGEKSIATFWGFVGNMSNASEAASYAKPYG
jgi:hypothetical protein